MVLAAATIWVRGLVEFAVVFALILTERALADAERLSVVFHPFAWPWLEGRCLGRTLTGVWVGDSAD